MSITLFNRGKRVIVGTHPGKFEKGKLDKRGNSVPVKFAFKPESAMAFDEETAAKLMRLYPGEVLSVKDVQKQFEAIEEIPSADAAVEERKEDPRNAADEQATDEGAETEATEEAPDEKKGILSKVFG